MKLRIRWDSSATTKREFEVCRPGDEKNAGAQFCLAFSALVHEGVSPQKARQAVEANGAWIDLSAPKSIIQA
jgi:hypothetical protein